MVLGSPARCRRGRLASVRRGLVAGAAVLLLVACSDGAALPEASPATSAVRDDVTVSGAVTRLLAPNAFVLGDRPPEALLVVSAAPAPNRGDHVEVTGRVVEFHRESLGAELGVDLEVAALRAFEGQPCLVASELRPVPPS